MADLLQDFPKSSQLLDGGLPLSVREVRLRLCHARDLPFLYRLYRHLRDGELDRTGWTEKLKRSFCEQQFNAQHTDYLRRFPAADYLMVLHRRDPIGRLYVDAGGMSDADMHVLDLGLLPAWRGQGIGSALLTALQKFAAAQGRAVTLSVLQDNFRAVALYKRLGFVATDRTETRFSMRWAADR